MPRLVALLVALTVGWLPSAARAAGPLVVNGAGEPLVWTASPIPFNPDTGSLGMLDNVAATAAVTAAFATWAAVPTAAVAGANTGSLPVDVDVGNYTLYVGGCGDGMNPIIFDTDGSITEDLFGPGASDDVLGFASPDCGTYTPAVITEGSAVLNGKWIDGITSPTNPELPLADFTGVLVHEFGHYLNLDHSQINLLEGLDADPGNDGTVATMFPFLVNGTAQASLALDDQVSVSMLYPAPLFATAFGAITGAVLRSDATTPFQGAYVVARRIGDARTTAVGMVSGARFFPATQGGPPAPGLEGSYELRGLPPGSYTIEIEPVDPTFTGASSVGPLDPPATLPGAPEFWNDANEASTNPPDDPAAAVSVTVAAGATVNDIDVVINAPPPAQNDDCTAPTIAVPPFHDLVDTTAATRAATDPFQSCSTSGPSQNSASVWYRFSPATTGSVRVETVGSTYDTVLTVYTGTCGSLTEVACNDDEGGALPAGINFVAAAGVTYLIEATKFGAFGGGLLNFSLEFTPGCGNGTREGGEVCDDGAGNGNNGCCSIACGLVDGDVDGVCDRDDLCPAFYDPGQLDDDGDGLGDACDPCQTITAGQGTWLSKKLVVSNINDGNVGNDRLKIRGAFTMATGGFTINPLTTGAYLEVRSSGRVPKISVLLPPGAFTHPGPGWIKNASGTRFIFRNLNPGGTRGITKLQVTDLGNGNVRVAVVGKYATFPVVPGDAPLEATVVLTAAPSVLGECGELTFPGPPPAPTCNVNRGQTKISCR